MGSRGKSSGKAGAYNPTQSELAEFRELGRSDFAGIMDDYGTDASKIVADALESEALNSSAQDYDFDFADYIDDTAGQYGFTNGLRGLQKAKKEIINAKKEIQSEKIDSDSPGADIGAKVNNEFVKTLQSAEKAVNAMIRKYKQEDRAAKKQQTSFL